MNENNTTTNKPAKTYINGNWIREKTFANGGSILTVNILPDRFIDSIKSLKPDDAGFVRLVISKRLNPDEKSTHTLYLDEFKPSNASVTTKSVADKPMVKSTPKKTPSLPVEAESDENSF